MHLVITGSVNPSLSCDSSIPSSSSLKEFCDILTRKPSRRVRGAANRWQAVRPPWANRAAVSLCEVIEQLRVHELIAESNLLKDQAPDGIVQKPHVLPRGEP